MSLRYLSHQVWHKIDESSPLYRLRSKLHMYIDGIEVSVTAVDRKDHADLLMQTPAPYSAHMRSLPCSHTFNASDDA